MRTRKTPIIFIDTPLFIYLLEKESIFSEKIRGIFLNIEAGKYFGITSVVTIHEILIRPIKEKNIALVATYKQYLTSFPNLSIEPITLDIAVIAAQLRSKYSALRAADAFQLSVAINNKAEVFLTSDKRLKQIQEIKVILI